MCTPFKFIATLPLSASARERDLQRVEVLQHAASVSYARRRSKTSNNSVTVRQTCRYRSRPQDEPKRNKKGSTRAMLCLSNQSISSTSTDEAVVNGQNGNAREQYPARAYGSQTLLSILDGNKYDPFNTFCIDASLYERQHQKIFDHAINAQWSLFASSSQESDLALVKTEVMSHIIHSPVSYYTFLYAGACHRLFWKEGFERSPERTSELLRLKAKAVRAMIIAVGSGTDAPSEEVVMAMVVLAAHGSAENAQRRKLGKVQGRKSLVRTLEAEYWCALDTEVPHMEVLADMVRRRGGVKNMRSGVLLTALYLFDIFDSFTHLKRPRLDSLIPFNMTLAMRTWSCDAHANQRLKNIMWGFSGVFSCMGESMLDKKLQEVVLGFILVELDLDQFKRSTNDLKSTQPHYTSVIWIRSICVREVLLLPENLTADKDIIEESQLALLAYEMCRLSCLLVCQVWLFADCSSKRNLARSLVDKLYLLLWRATQGTGPDKLCERLPDFFLWSLVLGLMLAYEDFDTTGDAKGLHKLAPLVCNSIVKPNPTAWFTIRGSLEKFLWPVREQEETGREAWNTICQILVVVLQTRKEYII